MSEEEFNSLIDCNFPYDDNDKAYILINKAFSISNNAVCDVLHELARVPNSVKISKTKLFEMLDFIEWKFKHPLKKHIFYVAREMIKGKSLSCTEVSKIIDLLKSHNDVSWFVQYLYFACDDKEDILDKKYDELYLFWDNQK